MSERLRAARCAIAWLCLSSVAVACSGGEPPPPPPPPEPVAQEAPPEPPPTVVEPPPVAPASTPAAAPPPARTPRTLALTRGGGCAIQGGRILCWGISPRADEDETPAERPEVQLTGDFVDLVANDELACALRAPATANCWGEPMEIAEDVRAYEQQEAEDSGEDWVGEDDEQLTDLDVVSGAVTGGRDLGVGFGGACVVRGVGTSQAGAAQVASTQVASTQVASTQVASTQVECAGSAFEPRAVEGVAGAEGVVEVCVGDTHACGRTADGHVRCWGDNDVGQLGDGLEDERAESATRVRSLDRVLHLACGEQHSCALRDDGSVWCWGDNTRGQLAQPDEALELAREPLRVPGLEDVRAVVAGGGASCALFDEGPPRCWGDNYHGLLGTGHTRSTRAPVEASALGAVRELVLSYEHACAVRGDDASREVVCWGLGGASDIGAIGTRARRRSYAPVRLFEEVAAPTSLVLGPGSICVRSAEGTRCVGREGADPDAGLEGARTARPVTAPLSFGGPERRSARWSCVHEGARLTCRQSATPDAAPVVLEGVTSVAMGSTMICAGHQDGTVECAVDAAGSALLRFVTLTHLPPASFIAMPFPGLTTLCVVTREGGRLVCEGPVVGHQAGIEPFPLPSPEDAGPADPSRPVTPPMHRYRDVEGIVQVVARGGVAVRLADGRVMRLSPIAVPAPMLDRVESMHEGASFVCARRIGESGGEAWCWGAGPSGELARRDPSSAPVRIAGLEVPVAPAAEGQPPVDLRTIGVLEVATSLFNACARLSDGRVLCWGEERDGQLGRLPETLRLRPVVVLD